MFRTIILLASLMAMAPDSRLAAAETPLTVEEVLTSALEKSPLAAAIRSKAEIVRGEGITVKTLANPELGSEIRFPLSDTSQDVEAEVSLSQPLRPSDFGVRSTVNELMAQAADQSEALELLELALRVRLLFGKAWLLSERKAQLDTSLSKSRSILKLVREGMERGLFGKGEDAVFRAEEKKLLAEKWGIEADFERARAELTRHTGMALAGRVLQKPVLRDLPIEGVDKSSLASRIQLLVKLAEEQARLARLDSYPKFAPRLVYEHTDDGNSFVGAGLSVALPVFDRNRGESMKREAQSREARSLAEYYSSAVFDEELEALAKSARASLRQSELFATEVIPSLQEALDLYETQLKAGQGTILQIWQIARELDEARMRSSELFGRSLGDRAELGILIGKDL